MQDAERKKHFAALWARATAALARREHSECELRQKLKLRDEFDLAGEVIEALFVDDLVSDERFAHMLCRSRFNKGVGPVRIEHELNQHQIRAEWIEAAMAGYAHRWVDQLQDIKQRRYGDSAPVDYKSWAKQARFFQQRGFTSAQIQQAIPR